MKKITPLPNNIQAILDEKDMSVRQLAKKTGKSPAQLGRLIKGDAPLTTQWIFRLAEALGVKALEIVTLKLSKADLRKYDSMMLGSIMGYLIEAADDFKVPLNIDELSNLVSYLAQEVVERRVDDVSTRRLAINVIQAKKIIMK